MFLQDCDSLMWLQRRRTEGLFHKHTIWCYMITPSTKNGKSLMIHFSKIVLSCVRRTGSTDFLTKHCRSTPPDEDHGNLFFI
ncbi:unnamed protein product [Gadus morhua 'NCC']